MESYINGRPGVRTERIASNRNVFRDGVIDFFYAGGKTINGSLSRDSGNTGYLTTLRAGLPLGRITSSGKYAPSIIGVTTNAEVVGSTAVEVTAAQAVELVRRVGATGTFTLRGPAGASGPVDTQTVTYSAVDTSTGAITVTALTKPFIAGSFVQPSDGSEFPRTVVPDGWGIKVTDPTGADIDVEFEHGVPCGGCLLTANLLHWPSDTSLRLFIKESLRSASPLWMFDTDW